MQLSSFECLRLVPRPAPGPPAFLVSRGLSGSGDLTDAIVAILGQIGPCVVIDRPESRLLFAATQVSDEGYRPVHVSLRAPHEAYLSPAMPNVLFVAWDYPHIPAADLSGSTRLNWKRILGRADLVIAPSRFVADAIRREGVGVSRCDIVQHAEGSLDSAVDWNRKRPWVIDCSHLVLGEVDETETSETERAGREWLREIVRSRIESRLGDEALQWLATVRRVRREEPPRPALSTLRLERLTYLARLDLAGSGRDVGALISAFVLAFRDRPDATLVIALEGERAEADAEDVRAVHRNMGVTHRCRVVVLTEPLVEARWRELLNASTYYVETCRADGVGWRVRDALVAGRPVISPDHSALGEWVDETVGFVVRSDPEPTSWPCDPEGRLATEWNRVVWVSLRDRLLESAAVARRPKRYRALAEAARARGLERTTEGRVVASWRKALGSV